MRDCDNPNAIELLPVNNAKRKALDFVTSGLKLLDTAMQGVRRYLCNRFLDCAYKFIAEKCSASLVE